MEMAAAFESEKYHFTVSEPRLYAARAERFAEFTVICLTLILLFGTSGICAGIKTKPLTY